MDPTAASVRSISWAKGPPPLVDLGQISGTLLCSQQSVAFYEASRLISRVESMEIREYFDVWVIKCGRTLFQQDKKKCRIFPRQRFMSMVVVSG